MFFKGATEISEELREKFKTVLELLERFLDQSPYFAGDEPTLADISIFSTIIYLKNIFGTIVNLPNIEAWLTRCADLPGYEENMKMAAVIKDLFEMKGFKIAPLK